VTVKVHPPRESRETLEAVHAVQSALFRAGFPCPQPLVGPTPLGHGLAVIETLIDEGEFRDTHEPARRRLMAEAFAWHLELTRECGRPRALTGTRGERGQIAACATFLAAYTARCEHCGYGGYDAAADANSFTAALREHGLDYLVP
jgi:hypothetical protein